MTDNILDPFGTISRLIFLKFREKNNKIWFGENEINIQEPGSGQTLSRYWNKQGRDNMCDLYYPVIKMIEWYIIPLYDKKFKITRNLKNKINVNMVVKKDGDDSKSDEVEQQLVVEDKHIDQYWTCIKKIVEYCCDALSKFQYTYGMDNAVLTTQYLIILLKDALEGKYSRERLPKCISPTNSLSYDKIKSLWSFQMVNEVYELYDKCFVLSDDITKSIKNRLSYDDALEIKDYVDFDKSKLSDDDKLKLDKIEGYLKAIDHLLCVNNGEFKKLLKHT